MKITSNLQLQIYSNNFMKKLGLGILIHIQIKVGGVTQEVTHKHMASKNHTDTQCTYIHTHNVHQPLSIPGKCRTSTLRQNFTL